MNPSKLRRTLKQGGHVFGCMLSPDGLGRGSARYLPAVLSTTRSSTTEHSSRDRTEIQSLVGMLRQADITTDWCASPIPKAEWVAMAHDAGTAGVLVPYCETVEEVQAVVATAKWHPLKGGVPGPGCARSQISKRSGEKVPQESPQGVLHHHRH